MEQMRKNAPGRSIWSIFCLKLRSLCSRCGFLKKMMTVMIAIAPIGKFIQKHHRHVRRSVNTPPRMGPMTEEMPNMLDNKAIYIARCRSGTE